MNTIKLAIGAALIGCTSLCGVVLAGEAIIQFSVPKSAYAFKDTPPCAGWQQTALELFKDESFVSDVSAINPYAGAVVATIGFYDSISAGHGGELSKLIRKLHGGSYSICLSAVYALPAGVEEGHIELSNRHGALTTKLPLTEGVHPMVIASDDWSAWRNVAVKRVGGRYLVSATASNWLHNGASNQVLKVSWTSTKTSANQLKQSFSLVGVEPTDVRVSQLNPMEKEPNPAQ